MKNHIQKPVQITIGISDAKFLHFESTTRIQELKESITPDSYEFQFDLNSNLNEQDKVFDVFLSVTLFEKQNQITKIELANIKTATSFRIANYDEIIKKDKKQIMIPDQLVSLTAGIALSTTRGMFAMSTQNSIISNAIIPIIDPRIFISRK